MKNLTCWLIVGALAAVGCSNDPQAPSSQRASIGDGEQPGAARSLSDAAPSAAASGSSAALPAAAFSSSSPALPAGFAPSSAPMAATPSGGAVPVSTAGVPVITGGGNGQLDPGTLTAGTWDDNRNYDRFMQYRAALKQQQVPGLLPSSDEEHASANREFSKPLSAHQTLDIALMIDTTGSMGDEIRYLQTEFMALSQAIELKYPDAEQRWALVAYRDTSDTYLTRWYDFRDDAADFRDKLGMLAADGGGDFPEAPDAALAVLNQLGWRSDANTARLAFWVADAPHHADKAQAMLTAIRDTHASAVHMYPVASSGVDDLTELSMRSAAQLTGGRYLFLTDDSGVGGAHKEPSIPCYFVTHLDRAILRMVDIEITGQYREPEPVDVVRTGGDPQNGACRLESGETVTIF
jgi:hypothetical protein